MCRNARSRKSDIVNEPRKSSQIPLMPFCEKYYRCVRPQWFRPGSTPGMARANGIGVVLSGTLRDWAGMARPVDTDGAEDMDRTAR